MVRLDGNHIWPTLAYERSREGIDDLRYLTLLEQLIKQAKSSGQATTEVSRANALLAKISGDILDNWTAYTDGGQRFPSDGFEVMSPEKSAGLGHYQSLRRAVANAIVDLQAALKK